MVGIFQLFGISFLFWMAAGFLRFVFETLGKLRATPRKPSRLLLTLSAFSGVAVSASLFLVLFLGFHLDQALQSATALPAIVITTFVIWATCVTTGAFIAARISIHQPYFVALTVGLGTVAASLALLALANATGFAGDALWRQVVWAALTLASALFGGHIATALNALEREKREDRAKKAESARILPEDVAILIAAHNEELSIGSTVKSVLKFAKPENIYVASDGSSDDTVDIVRSLKAHAENIQPNRGKAGALAYVVKKQKLLENYKAIFLLDADMQVRKDFFARALPAFDDPRVAAVSGYFETLWPRHWIPEWRLLIPAYRIRLWRVLQFLVRYGQTWKYINASPIVPGGASIYRTSVLKHIQIDAPGLIIEDFNMTFEMHHKNLGFSVFEPSARVLDQEPYSIHEFVKQIKRWYLGYFQTIRRHGVWPSLFCLFTYFFTIELIVSALAFLLLPFFLLELLASRSESLYISFGFGGYTITLLGVLLAIIVFDYLMTIVVAMIEKKPMLLFYGLFFFPIRYIEMVIFLYTIPVALLGKSDGKWTSPKRIAFDKDD